MVKIILTLALAAFSMASFASNYYSITNFNLGNTHLTKDFVKAQKAKVVVYGAKWCGACQVLKKNLNAAGIKYTYIDIDKGHYPHIKGIPVTVINGKTYVGSMSTAELKRLIK
jgi:glutaredoxin